MATWVVEGRYPVAGGTWYNIGNFADMAFRKEVNTKWTGGFTAYTPIPPQGGLKLHYDMEKLTDAGLMSDLSGLGNNGTITGVVDVAGKYGRARTFTAAGDKVSAGDVLDFGTGAFTVCGWVKTSSAASVKVWASKWTLAGAARGWACYMSSGTLIMEIEANGASSSNITSPTTKNDGVYHHVACVFDRNGSTQAVLSLYVDGVLVAGPTTFTGQNGTVDNATSLEIGNAGTNQWVGDIDEIYIYGRALSVSEIIDIRDTSTWDLLQNNNEIRFRETGAAKEWFRGRIRDRTADEVSNEAKIGVVDNSILVADAKWIGRRTFPAVPANVIMDELLNSAEGEPRFAQKLRWDLETKDGTSYVDLSGFGHAGAPAGGSTVLTPGKYGNGLRLTASSVTTADTTDIRPTSAYSVAYYWRVHVWAANTTQFHLAKGAASVNWFLEIVTDGAGNYKFQVVHDTTTAAGANRAQFAVDVWHHIIWTYDNTNVRVYLDGTLMDTIAIVAPAAGNSNPLGFPQSSITATEDFDECYIYPSRVITSAERDVLRGIPILKGNLGTVDTFTAVGFRSEDEQRLNLVDALARAVAGEWFVDRDGSDQDRMNLVTRIGSASSQDTFQFGISAILRDRKYDTETVVNDWVAIGNDATKQLKSRNFQATTLRTTLTADLTAAATTATVADTTGLPATGNLYIGGERVNYTGTTSTTFTGLTRAYTADGYPSLAAYAHSSGIEVWLHSDNDATPDNYYTPFTPQNDSSIKKWGIRGGTYTDQFYNDQNALDRLAQRLSGKFKDPRESVIIEVYEETVTCDIGDAVTVNDENGATYFNSPYRVFAIEYNHNDSLWTLELGNYRDTFDRRVAEVRDDAGDAMYYAASAATTGAGSSSGSDVTITTTTEKAIVTGTGSGIRGGQKVLVKAWAQLTTGTNTTSVTPRIRRGSGITGALIGEANAEGIKIAAGGTEPFFIAFTDTAQNDDPVYTFTLTQAGATGNGTALQYSIEIVPIG